jgi:hypothetical protein
VQKLWSWIWNTAFSQYNHCILEEDDANIPLQHYFEQEFNQEVARGNTTPHQLHFGLAYNSQLQYPPPQDSQSKEDSKLEVMFLMT